VKKLNARTSHAWAPFFKSHPFAGILTPKVFVPGCIRARLLSVGWQNLRRFSYLTLHVQTQSIQLLITDSKSCAEDKVIRRG
jgi:hypothetical protein